jgi:hypothetical protein
MVAASRGVPQLTTEPMEPSTQLTHFAGFDWAKDHHDVVIVDAQGHIVADFRIEHTAEEEEGNREDGGRASSRLAALAGKNRRLSQARRGH